MDTVSATVPSSSRYSIAPKGAKENMMLLSQYLEDNGLIKRHRAKVYDATDNGDTITVLYRVDGQKYKSDKDYSARNLSRSVYDAQEVDKDGYLTTGRCIRKSNFWVWTPDSENEA